MEQKRISRFLLLAGWAAMAGLAVVFLGFIPITLWSARAWLGGWAAALGTAYALGIGGLYFGALRLYMTICRRIGQGRSFCAENAAGLDRIGRLLLAAAGLWLLGEAGYAVADLGIAGLYFPLLALASAALGVLAWALGRLLRHAVRLQEENDWTV